MLRVMLAFLGVGKGASTQKGEHYAQHVRLP
jgi:hypothetical protein